MKILPIVSAVALAFTLATQSGSTTGSRERIYSFRYDNILGTSLELKVGASSLATAQKAESAVLGEIHREAKILSSWDPDSEVSRWARTHGQRVAVSEDLFRILSLYDQWQERTHGALNASAQTVIGVWKDAAKADRLPESQQLAAAVQKAGEKQWTLDPADRTATRTSDAALVLASFTKSYIIDRAADAALQMGVHSVVLNIGGDLAVRGALTEAVDIANPRSPEENAAPLSRIMVHDLAVATSGDYRRGVEVGGQHYSHIVDPRTGMPAQEIISSTVVAPNPTDAGALATAFSILTPEESARLAASIPGVAYLLVKKNGEQVRSKNWKALEVAPGPIAAAMAAASPTPAAGTWDPSMELTMNFELAPKGGSAKFPFVAAWVEDADRFQIRTIAVWYREGRYITEMKAWYRSDRVRAMAEGKEIVRSVSSATRGPGKYSFKWDGKDNEGKPVKAGKYTVYLEVARELGTYQLMKKEMDFSGKPQEMQFPANTEVAGASFVYHKTVAK